MNPQSNELKSLFSTWVAKGFSITCYMPFPIVSSQQGNVFIMLFLCDVCYSRQFQMNEDVYTDMAYLPTYRSNIHSHGTKMKPVKKCYFFYVPVTVLTYWTLEFFTHFDTLRRCLFFALDMHMHSTAIHLKWIEQSPIERFNSVVNSQPLIPVCLKCIRVVTEWWRRKLRCCMFILQLSEQVKHCVIVSDKWQKKLSTVKKDRFLSYLKEF